MPKPIFRNDVMKMEDMKVGMQLTGTVRNVVDSEHSLILE